MVVSRRNLFKVSLAAGAGAVLAACGRRDDSTSAGTSSAPTGSSTAASINREKIVDLAGAPVAALFTSLNNDYYASWDIGARRAVEAFGGTYRALVNEGDPAKQISQVEQQIQDGVKIIFMTAPDPANVPTIAKLASDNKVYLTNTWEMVPWTTPWDYGDGYVTYFSADSVNAGYEVAKALFDKMGGAGNFVHLTGHPGSTPDTQRTQGVDKALAEYPNVKLIARQPGEWNRDDARSAMAGVITKFGKDIGGVFGQNDDVAIGASNALQEAGVSGVPVVGVDGNKGTMDLIKAGTIFGSYSTLPFWSAGFSAVRAIDASQGVKFEAADRQVWTDGIFVTADNVDSYLGTFFGDNDPFDWQLMSRKGHPEDWDPQNGIKPLIVDQMWEGNDKPSGWKAPAAYTEALPTFPQVQQEWTSQWKVKLI
jgi:ribose transport system substrate-binding protein